MFTKNKKLKISTRGFSLIETMVAITILVMVITGPITLASNSLKAASVSKNNFIASNLAQEGVELIRLLRTNNVIQGNDWMQDIRNGQDNCNGSCYVDAKSLTLQHCTGQCPFLNIDSGGFYNYTSGTPTIFRRTISVQNVGAAGAYRIVVTIDWTERYGAQSIVLEEIIHDWIQ